MDTFEILLPFQSNEGESFAFERAQFLQQCLDACGGFTECPSVRGAWNNTEGKTFRDTSIPVRIVCLPETALRLAHRARHLFRQEAILLSRVATDVQFVTAEPVSDRSDDTGRQS